MPTCGNCEGFVTDNYVRVFARPELDAVRVYPHCEDKLRERSGVREAHSSRG